VDVKMDLAAICVMVGKNFNIIPLIIVRPNVNNMIVERAHVLVITQRKKKGLLIAILVASFSNLFLKTELLKEFSKTI